MSPTHQNEFEALCDAPGILKSVNFAAKIDYLKIGTAQKCALPKLSGQPRWSAKEHYKSLTIHDATSEDVAKLATFMPGAPVIELEVAIDARPRAGLELPPTEAELLLAKVVLDVYASGLDPDEKTGINKAFRGAYRHFGTWGCLKPFDMRKPLATDQQLHGSRQDDCQVKVYLKRTDMRADLDASKFVARTEVRLGDSALATLGVHSVEDLFGFRFRKKLMPFFRHIRGTRRRSNSRGKLKGPLLELMRERQEKDDAILWDEAGVGAFSGRGHGLRHRVYLIRDSAVNDRLGQALLRLERDFAAAKFVHLRPPSNDGKPPPDLSFRPNCVSHV